MRAASPSAGTHLVQSGDTAWNIAHRYGISVDELAAANGGSTTVKLGQRLVIPGGQAPQGVQVASLNPQEVAATARPRRCRKCRSPPRHSRRRLSPPQQPAVEQQVALAPQTGTAGSLAPAAPQQRPARLPLAGARPRHLRFRQEGERRA